MDQVLLETHEQEAFLRLMASARDPRLRSLGHNVSSTIHRVLGFGHPASSEEQANEEARRQVAASLESQLQELWRLRNEVIPEAIRGPTGDESQLGNLAIDTNGVHFMNDLHQWHVQLEVERFDPQARRLFGFPSFKPKSGAGSSSSSAAAAAGGSLDDVGSKSAADQAAGALMKYARLSNQAEAFFKQAQEFAAKNYNIHIPDMREATRGVNTKDMMTCGMQAVMTANPERAMKCAMQFWSVAMDVMQNVFSSIGPVTTSTPQTAFNDFNDMMN